MIPTGTYDETLDKIADILKDLQSLGFSVRIDENNSVRLMENVGIDVEELDES